MSNKNVLKYEKGQKMLRSFGNYHCCLCGLLHFKEVFFRSWLHLRFTMNRVWFSAAQCNIIELDAYNSTTLIINLPNKMMIFHTQQQCSVEQVCRTCWHHWHLHCCQQTRQSSVLVCEWVKLLAGRGWESFTKLCSTPCWMEGSTSTPCHCCQFTLEQRDTFLCLT